MTDITDLVLITTRYSNDSTETDMVYKDDVDQFIRARLLLHNSGLYARFNLAAIDSIMTGAVSMENAPVILDRASQFPQTRQAAAWHGNEQVYVHPERTIKELQGAIDNIDTIVRPGDDKEGMLERIRAKIEEAKARKADELLPPLF